MPTNPILTAPTPEVTAALLELRRRGIDISPYLRPNAEDVPQKIVERHERSVAGLPPDPRRDTLSGFVRAIMPTYSFQPMHRLIASKLERALRTATGTLRPGETPCRRLMITAPPRHGKTELVSKMFPAWALGNYPSLKFIVTSYATDLAADNSYWVQRYLQSEEFRRLFPGIRLDPRSESKEMWGLAERTGGMRAAGVGAGITGFGSTILLGDDLFKDMADARSKAIQDRTWDWYTSVAYSRLEGQNAVVIHIGTRWDEEDVQGKLLANARRDPNADQWERVYLKAIAEEVDPDDPDDLPDPLGREPGEVLWPTERPLSFLMSAKANDPDTFEAVYQGRPRPPKGTLFQKAWFKYITPAKLREKNLLYLVRIWDLAVTKKTSADWTVGALCAVDEDANLYIIDIKRWKEEWPESRKRIKAQIAEDREVWGCDTIGFESVAFQSAAVQEFRADPELMLTSFHGVRPDADKRSRAVPWAARTHQGKVYLVDGEWIGDFIREAIRFDGLGKGHDDQVDAVSYALAMMVLGGFVVTGSPASGGMDASVMPGNESEVAMATPPAQALAEIMPASALTPEDLRARGRGRRLQEAPAATVWQPTAGEVREAVEAARAAILAQQSVVCSGPFWPFVRPFLDALVRELLESGNLAAAAWGLGEVHRLDQVHGVPIAP